MHLEALQVKKEVSGGIVVLSVSPVVADLKVSEKILSDVLSAQTDILNQENRLKKHDAKYVLTLRGLVNEVHGMWGNESQLADDELHRFYHARFKIDSDLRQKTTAVSLDSLDVDALRNEMEKIRFACGFRCQLPFKFGFNTGFSTVKKRRIA